MGKGEDPVTEEIIKDVNSTRISHTSDIAYRKQRAVNGKGRGRSSTQAKCCRVNNPGAIILVAPYPRPLTQCDISSSVMLALASNVFGIIVKFVGLSANGFVLT